MMTTLYLKFHIFPRWSYGVVLWEMYSCGMVPYSGMKSHELVEYLNEGRRMKPPDQCPEEIYNIMLECWNDDPDSRPSMLQLYDKLNVLRKSVATTDDVSIQVFVVKIIWNLIYSFHSCKERSNVIICTIAIVHAFC